MSFPKSFLDELKARIRVSDVVGRRVKLVRRGREFVGLSPFTNEKTPSFTVNDEKQFYHCFSTGEHGDIIRFLEKVENLSFLEAVERLAGEAGLDMPERDEHSIEREKQSATLIDVMELAAGFFRRKLAEGVGAEARAYLERRGMKAATLETFQIGYAPEDRHALMGFLKTRNVSIDQMAEAGLIISGPDIPEPYDRFRNRIIYPIADTRGRCIAFGGRALDPAAKAKYLNSPDTPLFHKGHGLYNLHRARKPAFDKGTVIAVEGYMDVIGLAQGGIENAVAPLGTALTEEQIALMWRMAPEPILCFDGDKAGLRAAFRAVERVLPLLKPGHSLRFAMLPEGKDPDDMVREEGVEAINVILDAARPLSDMLWEKEVSAGQWDTPERRAALESRIETVVGLIADPRVRGYYQQDLRGRLQKLFGTGRAAQAPFRRGGGGFRPQGAGGRWTSGSMTRARGRDAAFVPPVSAELKRTVLAADTTGSDRMREGLMLLIVLNHPELLDFHGEELAQVEIKNTGLDRLRNEIIDIAALNAPLDREALRAHLTDRGLAEIARRLEGVPAYRNDRFAWPDASPEKARSGFLHVMARHRRQMTLEVELKAATRALADDMTEENLARLRDIHAQLEHPDQIEDGMA